MKKQKSISKKLSNLNAEIMEVKLNIGFHLNEVKLLFKHLTKIYTKFEQLKLKQLKKVK